MMTGTVTPGPGLTISPSRTDGVGRRRNRRPGRWNRSPGGRTLESASRCGLRRRDSRGWGRRNRGRSRELGLEPSAAILLPVSRFRPPRPRAPVSISSSSVRRPSASGTGVGVSVAYSDNWSAGGDRRFFFDTAAEEPPPATDCRRRYRQGPRARSTGGDGRRHRAGGAS